MAANYGLQKVEAVPARRHGGGGGRSLASVLRPLFESIVAEADGEWYQIGEWGSATGASTAKRAIEKDPAKYLPEGFLFDLQSRRITDKSSALFARLVDDQEPTE